MKKLWTVAGILIFCAGLGWGANYEWTGYTDSDWGTASNWSGSAPPPPAALSSGDTLIINSGSAGGAGDDPLITDNFTIGTLTITNGTLALGGYNLSATSITNTGTISLDGTQTVTTTTPPATIGGIGTVIFNGPGTTLAGITNFGGNLTISTGPRTAASLSVTGASAINASVTTTGAQVYTGAVTLGADVVLDSGNGNIGFSSTVNSDAPATPRSLELKAGAGTITFGGAVGGGNPLNNLGITSGTVAAGGTAITVNGNLSIGGTLNAGSRSISVGGDWTNSGAFNCGTGTVLFTGAGTHAVTGGNAFYNLTCAGTMSFAGGATQTVTNVLNASAATALTSASSPSKWRLNLSGTFTGGSVIISYCEAVSYLGLIAGTNAVNGGNNIWVFQPSGNAYTWTGGTDTDWSTHSNWDAGQYPPNGAGAVVTIPSAPSNQPVLSAGVTIGSLTIDPSSSLDLNGWNLTVAATLTNSGIIRLLGAESVSVPSGTPGGTVSYYGTAAAPPRFGTSYTNLTIEAGADTTAWTTPGFTVSGVLTVRADLRAASVSVTGSASIGADVVTSGAGGQTYNGPVTLTANGTDFIAGINTVRFGGTVNGDAASRTLTVGDGSNATKAVFGGTVGGSLASIRVYGTSAINAAAITTTGAQTYTGAVTLGTNVTLNSGSGNIEFGGTVSNTSSQTLSLTPGTGKAIFKGNVGSGTALTTVTVAGTSGIEIDGIVTIQTNDPIAFSGHPLTLPGSIATTATLVSTGGSISLGQVSRTSTGTKNLTLTAASGAAGSVTFGGAAGSAAEPLGTVSVTQAGGGVSIPGSGSIYAGTISLNTNAGISGTGQVTGSSLTATAKTGVSLTAANNVATVTLNNNVLGATGGITYNSGRGSGNTLAVTVNQAANNTVTVTETSGAIAVGGVTGPGSGGVVSFQSADNQHITIGGTINGIERLVLKAGTSAASTGNVAIGANITVSGNGTGHADTTAAVYVWAKDITGSAGTVTPGSSGAVCAWLDSSPSYTGTVAGNRIHIHPRNGGHIVYRRGGDPGNGFIPDGYGGFLNNTVFGSEYFYVQSDSGLALTLVYDVALHKNVYIIDVGTQNRTLTFNCSGTGFIEIRGSYQSNLPLTLNPGTGGVRLANSDVTPTDPGVVNLTASAFTIPAGANLQLRGGTGTAASITATAITLPTVTGTGDLVNNLTLSSTGAVSVTGNMGSSPTARLGNIRITTAAGAAFSGSIWANSFTQAAGTGTTQFTAAQNYDGVNASGNGFEFAGTNLTLDAGLTTSDTANSGAGGKVVIANAGIFATGSAGTISAGGVFSQSGGGTNSIGANITTRNTTAANASISFAQKITLTGSVTLDSSAGNGTITLPSTSGVSVDYTAAGNFGLASGTGDITINGSVAVNGTVTQTGAGATTKLYGNITTVNQNISFAGPVELYNPIAISTGTGAGNISLSGAVTSPSTPRNFTLTAGTGSITVSGTVGDSTDRLGILKILSAANVTFSSAGTPAPVYAASFDQSNAAGTGSGGTGLTTFHGPQDYTGEFKFIGTNLTVNNTLKTDTNTTGGDGDITVTADSGAGTFIVGASPGAILPGGSGTGGKITVTGHTTNNGAITAVTTNISVPLEFKGNYTSSAAGTLTGSANAAAQTIVFRGDAAFGVFTHNGDTVQFSGSVGTNHGLSAVGGTVTFADAVIDTGNTVTAASGTTVTQDPAVNSGAGGTLTLNGTLDTTAGNWFIGPPSLPSPWYMLSNPLASDTGDPNYPLNDSANPAPAFSAGFAGFNGKLTMGSGAVLTTKDFYTQITGGGHAFTLEAPTAAPNCAINASGNVTVNETFTYFIRSTLTMTGNGGKLAVRGFQPPGTPPPPWEAVVQLGDFVANAGSGTATATMLNSSVIFAGENAVTIRAGKWLKTYSGAYIRIDPESPLTGSKWVQEPGSTFDLSGTPAVEFGVPTSSPPPSGREFEIQGTTTWHNLICYEPRATLKFSNYPDIHSVSNKLELEPRSTIFGAADDVHANMIRLTRLTDPELIPPLSPGYIPPTSLAMPYGNSFWQFKLESTAEMYMNYVFLNYSYAVNRIPLPMAGSTVIVATPYVYLDSPSPPPLSNYALGNPRSDSGSGPGFTTVTTEKSYYNINWLVSDRFLYGFTEDWSGNGKIDRIRIQAAFAVTGDAEGSFLPGKFVVVVEGYEVIDYARADEDPNTPPAPGAAARMNDMIYVYVKEKDYTDTGARPVWWIAHNEGVFDLNTKTIALRLPEDEKMPAWDNVPPWINYALTVPEAKFTRPGYIADNGEIFVQFSESVDAASLGPVTGISSYASSPGIFPLDTTAREFIIPFTAPYTVTDLAVLSPPTFTLDKLQDHADYAWDRRSSGALYAYQYPSPKYPVDWNYNDYAEVQGDPLNLWGRASGTGIGFTVVTPAGALVPETVPKKDANASSMTLASDTGNKGVGSTPGLTHRVTDLLVSVPPDPQNPDSSHIGVHDNRYFVWPLWAKYKTLDPEIYTGKLGEIPGSGYGYMNSGAGAFTDTTVIWDFTGKRFLERSDDVLLQSRVNDVLSTATLGLRVARDVPDQYRAAAVHGPLGLWLPGSLPSVFRNMVPQFYTDTPLSMTPEGSGLYSYTFTKPVYGASNSTVEFFFHLDSSPADLFAGRLDIAPGAAIPGNWYRLVRPFSFGVHNITRQRGSVTILNNVINSGKRENVFLDYKLDKPGRVTVQVFTLDGNLVKVLVRENQSPRETYYRVAWNGTNSSGRPVARGLYFIRIVAPDIDEIRKVMVVK